MCHFLSLQQYNNNKISVAPKSLFPSSPEAHVRQTRKPMMRSPSPEAKPRTPAKSKTPAKAPKSTTKSARKTKEAEVKVLPVEEVEAVVAPLEPETTNEVTAEVIPTPSRVALSTPVAPFESKSALTLGLAFSVIGVIIAFFSSGSPVPSTPNFASSVSLKGSSTMYMNQGDTYVEPGVAFAPEIQKAILGGNSAPSISYEYSKPEVAFSDFLTEVGSFQVDYQVSAPWLGEIKLSREVIVSDVNECTYSGKNALFKHNCAPSQTCQNSVGSFSCV
jgi:hypothetical protein